MAFTPALVDRLPATLLAIHYLSLSYHYYQADISLVPDPVYDYICVRLEEKYDEIRDEIRKYVDRDDLRAGTCLKPYLDYPKRIYASADYYQDKMNSGQMAQWLEEEYPAQRARRRATAPAAVAVAPTARRRRPAAAIAAPAPTVRRRRTQGTT